MPVIRLLWYLLTPTSRWDHVWKVAVLTSFVAVNAMIIDVSFGFTVAERLPVYGVIIAVVVVPFLTVGMKMIKHMGELQAKLAHLAQTDLLTGLNNRRAFMDQTSGEQAGNLILLDIDHFKRINDTYGHDVGDRVLTQVAEFLTVNLRTNDIAARYGGEEFVLYLPDADLAQAHQVADRLVAGLQVHVGADLLDITMSAGVAWMSTPPGLEETLKRADQALYAVKHAGRACFKAWPLAPMAAV